MSKLPNFTEISDNLEFLDDWEDRYRYLIELGQMLAPLDESEIIEKNKIHGCASQVWLVVDEIKNNDKLLLNFRGDSDAAIVKGLVGIITSLFSYYSPSEIMNIDADSALNKLNLNEHLTSQRSNGLKAMIKRIQDEAKSRQ